jgi:hypothetical protein
VHWQELHLWKRDLVREAGDDRLKMLACSSSGAAPGVGYMLRPVISGNRVWHPQQRWKLLVDNCLADIENASWRQLANSMKK